MRISDWSSDVCSSDLQAAVDHLDAAVAATPTQPDLAAVAGRVAGIDVDHVRRDALFLATSHAVHRIALAIQPEVAAAGVDRGEVEEIGRASCRERGWQYG